MKSTKTKRLRLKYFIETLILIIH